MNALVILWILLAATAIAVAIVRLFRRGRRDSFRTLGFVSREWVEKYSTDHL